MAVGVAWLGFVALAMMSGALSGWIWRRLFADRGFGLVQLVVAVTFAIVVAAINLVVGAGIFTALIDGETARTNLALTSAGFVLVWLIGFDVVRRRRGRARMIRRVEVASAGAHDVTTYMRRAMFGPTASAPEPADGDRPLPPPLVVDDRETARPPAGLLAGVEDLRLPPPPPPA